MEIKEEWRTIEEYPNYMISNKGRVKSLKYGKERIMKQGKHKDNYCYIMLYKEGKGKKYLVHRLVTQAFISNPQNLPCVNHKDENPQNNHISNLEWCSYTYNINYGTRNEKVGKALSIAHKGRKLTQEHITNHSSSVRISIVQYDLDNKLIGIWESVKQASEILGIDRSNITKCCKGKYKTCNGYKWKYLQDFLIELKKAS